MYFVSVYDIYLTENYMLPLHEFQPNLTLNTTKTVPA